LIIKGIFSFEGAGNFSFEHQAAASVVKLSQVAGQRLNMGGSSAFIDHADAIGSTTMETDPSGAVDWDMVNSP
jgi:hypothetical protein